MSTSPPKPFETLEYVIDPADRIARVSPTWDVFAWANSAPHLVAQTVVGTLIWDYISGPMVHNLYQDFFTQARRTLRPIEFPFRCDAPERRRFLEMHILAQPDGTLVLTTRTVQEEPRPAVALLTLPESRGDDVLELCSFCKLVHLPDDTWAPAEEAVVQLDLFGEAIAPAGVTHSVCPACLPELHRRLGL